jgi:leucyl-tRNA synthetase
MEYHFADIEARARKKWNESDVYRVDEQCHKPKYYVLDMFPYPSGAGLHVGHPLGYIASDIYSRFKRHNGYNVLHPMGYDSFGLPAEQYAIQTGQHPAITTETNIKRYREQLDKIGFCFDWSREVRTSDPGYYRWTQWIFLKLYDSWYDTAEDKAKPISELLAMFEANGNAEVNAHCDETPAFTAVEWRSWGEERQQTVLLNYRIAYLSEAFVNWCPALGTVLANDEVKDGLSERGGHPVERKLMKQWSMRITAYAQRLLDGLDRIDWSDSLKEQQRNWIGRSEGAMMKFYLSNLQSSIPNQQSVIINQQVIVEVFTTRPDTIFGVSFVVLAPEHELVMQIVTPEQREEVEQYIARTKLRSERDRMADVKTVSGCFTGAYVRHPFIEADIPVWIGDYVLAGYGTGAVMAVPGGDQRDWNFARHFNLPIISVIEGTDIETGANESKEGRLINSDFLNGLPVKEAISMAIRKLEEKGIGRKRVNYRLRDAVFGRQRYWGEPIPIYYRNGVPYPVKEEHLPLTLPEIDEYLPTETGEPPLGRAKNWSYDPDKGVVSLPPVEGRGGVCYPLELSTMPGWAGSSWYYLRYTDPRNNKAFASPEAIGYWQNVDLYMGGSEHATGHLLYVRFWTKFLSDLGFVPFDEPAKKLVNQGMIQGRSNLIIKLKTGFSTPNSQEPSRTILCSFDVFEKWRNSPSFSSAFTGDSWLNKLILRDLGEELLNENKTTFQLMPEQILHVDVNLVQNDILDIEAFKAWRKEFADARFILNENGQYVCGHEVEKMSKSKWNVVNPDDIIDRYGADTLRLYEMFLGPLEDAKPWNTNGIEGTHRFLKKMWNLFQPEVTDEAPTKDELRTLHTAIRKVGEDIEKLSFNTCVSQFMICVNELTEAKCRKRAILEPLAIILSPFAPHTAEALWDVLGNAGSVVAAPWPQWKEEYLVKSEFDYPISFNGKTRYFLPLPVGLCQEEVSKAVMDNEQTAKYLEGKAPKKVIVVPGRIVNVVV